MYYSVPLLQPLCKSEIISKPKVFLNDHKILKYIKYRKIHELLMDVSRG